MKAKCIRFHKFGKPESVLKIENKTIQDPKNDEILVRMTASPINPSDLLPIRGAYAHRIPLPSIPGYEGVGIVEEVGSSVSKDLIGKRVLPLRGEGTWQEFVKTSAELAVPIPSSIDDGAAAQLYINPITAWITCTDILALKPNDILLVNACGSSIGRIYAQLSKLLGFQLIAITRNHTYTQELLQLGASQVINTSDTPLQPAVMELTNGRGVDAAIDSIGGVDGTELAFSVRPSGSFLTIGLLSGIPVNWKEISKRTNLNASLFHLRHWNKQTSVRRWQESFNRLISFINDKKLTLMAPHAYFNLQEVRNAVRCAESSQGNRGKVFLTNF
ncbi:alcohol dehydrogenase [Pueribacillus theae]|uniref:Alcohol dehydrogenase n=1 Tax=Pueribacillus theae TaxID=2171751 RepID=A0A2U1JX11_9BACI|nr:zinc-dependent alcohol dehydrogenase family protein [Pueribacillus theae]PWA09751.1 alcohol dehydrogenase [Pueribacillus theae]